MCPKGSESDTRVVLVNAAKKVFFAKGFEGATVKDIADEAGMNVSLVSYHFGGKEALYRECLSRFAQERFEFSERMLSSVDPAHLTLDDFRLRLTLFLSEFIEAHMREPEISGILHRELASGSIKHMEGIFTVFIQHFEAVVRFLSIAQTRSLIRKDVDPQLASGLLLSGIVQLMRMEPIAKHIYQRSFFDPAQRADLARTSVAIFLDGILVRSDRPRESFKKTNTRKTSENKRNKTGSLAR